MDGNYRDRQLLDLASTFETCIPFLPRVGQRSIAKAVKQLRDIAMGIEPKAKTPAAMAAAIYDAPDSIFGIEHALTGFASIRRGVA